jgi:hypothetical protein
MNVILTTDEKFIIPLADLVGTFRRFGERGPVYEIAGASPAKSGAEVELWVRVVETGEELSYPLRDVLSDPIER